MTAIKSTGAPRGSVLLAFGVHLKTTVQALSEQMGTLGIYSYLLLADTLFNDLTRDSIANNFVIDVYSRCLQILYQISFFYKI